MLDEIPALIEIHITSYRLARKQSQLPGISSTTREIYHTLNTHPALSPIPNSADPHTIGQQAEAEANYRQLLVHGVLAVLLPTEDLANVCLRTLVCDILADVVIGKQVDGKISEGWFLWESVTKSLGVLGSSSNHKIDATTATAAEQNQLQKFGLLSPKEETWRHHSSKTQLRMPDWVWTVLQLVYLTYVTLRFVVTGLLRVASTPGASTVSLSHANEAPDSCNPPSKRPVLGYRLYNMISQLLDIPQRMPWLGGLFALIQYLILAGPSQVGATDSVLDR
ncbi:PXA domain-containing protein [Aspergillus avenaceus]|uniref:PXA domain-containing protein n=1 Tax=Aspergillus avenaceus TaxID=36643 RepID=A0A5N6TD59_ASPAV|nr:PXA domain-containing protein [Aspergillus avenaceus]